MSPRIRTCREHITTCQWFFFSLKCTLWKISGFEFFFLYGHIIFFYCVLCCLFFFFLNKNSSYRNINKYRQSTVEHNLTHQPETIRLTQWFPTGVGEYLCLSRGHWECLDTVLIITAGGVELLVSSRLRPPKIPLNIQQWPGHPSQNKEWSCLKCQ